MEPGTTQTPTPSIDNDLAQRETLIATALRGIFEIAVTALKAENAPKDVAPLIDHGLSLIYCGLMALTEIAHAQTVLANLAQRDMAAEIDALAKDKAERLTEERVKEQTQRNFIGRKD